MAQMGQNIYVYCQYTYMFHIICIEYIPFCFVHDMYLYIYMSYNCLYFNIYIILFYILYVHSTYGVYICIYIYIYIHVFFGTFVVEISGPASVLWVS